MAASSVPVPLSPEIESYEKKRKKRQGRRNKWFVGCGTLQALHYARAPDRDLFRRPRELGMKSSIDFRTFKTFQETRPLMK